MKAYATTVLCFASFFWLWAVKNTVGMEASQFDLGILSFATVMLSMAYLLGLANHGKVPSSTLTKTLVLASITFVALNYALGCYLAFTALGRPGFGIYCGSFIFVWIGIGVWGTKAMSSGGSSSAGEQGRLTA